MRRLQLKGQKAKAAYLNRPGLVGQVLYMRYKMPLLDRLTSRRSSHHPHALGNVVRILWHIEFENLEHVDLLRAGRKAGIAEDGAERAALCDLLDHAFGNIRVKASDEVAVIVGMDSAAAQLLGLVRQGQRQPPVDQAAEQQVEVGAVILDVGFQPPRASP